MELKNILKISKLSKGTTLMWSNVTNTKETVAGLKKFYRFLVDTGSVDDADYRQFLAEVKSGMPEWLEHYRYLDEW